jgi:hypothetical protein
MMLEGTAGNEYPVDPTYANIHEFIEDWEDSWPIADSYFPPDPTLVAQAISNGTAVMVSDGLYKALLSMEIGAAAWILECSQTGATCCGKCSTSGLRSESQCIPIRTPRLACRSPWSNGFCNLSPTPWRLGDIPF